MARTLSITKSTRMLQVVAVIAIALCHQTAAFQIAGKSLQPRALAKAWTVQPTSRNGGFATGKEHRSTSCLCTYPTMQGTYDHNFPLLQSTCLPLLLWFMLNYDSSAGAWPAFPQESIEEVVSVHFEYRARILALGAQRLPSQQQQHQRNHECYQGCRQQLCFSDHSVHADLYDFESKFGAPVCGVQAAGNRSLFLQRAQIHDSHRH